MTPEQIHAMQAGRETDITVAEFLTGKSRLECRVDPMNRNGEPQFFWGYPAGHDFAPNYSTDIAAAFEMEAEIERRELAREYSDELQVLIENQTGRCRRFDYCHASPLDRCKAALLVLVGQQEGR